MRITVDPDFGPKSLPFWAVEVSGARPGLASPGDNVEQVISFLEESLEYSAAFLSREMKFVFPILGEPSPTGNNFDVLLGSQADGLSRNHRVGDECEAIDFATGQSYECSYERFGSTPSVTIGKDGDRPSGNRVGILFPKGNPQAFEVRLEESGKYVMVASIFGLEDDPMLFGNVLAHEIGHMASLKDIDNSGNIMHYAAKWLPELVVPFSISGMKRVESGTGIPSFPAEIHHQWERCIR